MRRQNSSSSSSDLARLETQYVNVAVTLRCRPKINALDEDGGIPSPLGAEINIDGERACNFKGVAYKFSQTYGPETSTSDIFDVHRDAVYGVLNGFDVTLMAYGSTGSGKTFTMLGTEERPGLTPLAIDALFERIAKGGSSGQSYALQVSAMELIEERCVDLLHGRAPIVLRSASKSDGGLIFHGLKEVPVSTKAELIDRISAATAGRTTTANYRHDASSRSHLIVRLRVDGARLISLGSAPSPRGSAPAAAADAEVATGSSARSDDGSGGDGGEVSLKDASSATLTLIDLAGSEAALLNTNAAAVAQGIGINKSLHWLKVAVHELAGKRPPQLRNSALTRLLTPSLTGGAHVVLVVCCSVAPAPSAARDAIDTLQFGEVAGRVTLRPTRRTNVEGGQLGQLQALLVTLADDKLALASDAAALRQQVDGYEELIAELKSTLVNQETLARAESMASTAAAQLASAQQRNAELARRCAVEEASNAALAAQLAEVEAAAAAATERNHDLLEATREASVQRHTLESRLAVAREDLLGQQKLAASAEHELATQREAVGTLQAQLDSLQTALESERATAAKRAAEAAALEQTNSALNQKIAEAREEVRAKNDLLLLRHKLYRNRSARRPSTAASRSESPRESPRPFGAGIGGFPGRVLRAPADAETTVAEAAYEAALEAAAAAVSAGADILKVEHEEAESALKAANASTSPASELESALQKASASECVDASISREAVLKLAKLATPRGVAAISPQPSADGIADEPLEPLEPALALPSPPHSCRPSTETIPPPSPPPHAAPTALGTDDDGWGRLQGNAWPLQGGGHFLRTSAELHARPPPASTAPSAGEAGASAPTLPSAALSVPASPARSLRCATPALDLLASRSTSAATPPAHRTAGGFATFALLDTSQSGGGAAGPAQSPPHPSRPAYISSQAVDEARRSSTKLDEARQAVDETASLSAVARSDDVPDRSFAARGRTAPLVSSLDTDRITGVSLASSRRRGLAGAEPAGSLLAREWIEEHKLEHRSAVMSGAARPLSGSAALSTALGGSGSDAVSIAVARAAEARRRAEGLMSSDTARAPPWRRTDAR
jgi:hypothetical protein